MQKNSKYAACISEFNNCIIRCFIAPKDEIQVPQFKVLSVFLNKSDSKFTLKLDFNLYIMNMRC